MSFPNLKLNQKMNINLPTVTLKVTERDKKLLAVFGVFLLIVLSYYLLYLPMSARLKTLKTEQVNVDDTVAAVQSDLKIEDQILLNYTTVLNKANESSKPFFPKVYPYKDRYILLLEKVITDSGATANGITFSDPEVSGVFQLKQAKPFILPLYPLQDLAKKINSANLNGSTQNAPTPGTTNIAAVAPNAADKTSPGDAVLRLPTTLTVKGSYAQIRAVIMNLEALKRKVAIEEISIQKDKDANMNAAFTLSFYAVEKVDNGVDPFNQWTLQGSYGKVDLFK